MNVMFFFAKLKKSFLYELKPKLKTVFRSNEVSSLLGSSRVSRLLHIFSYVYELKACSISFILVLFALRNLKYK